MPALLLALLLAACGGLPQPFRGRPGAEGALLAQPPPGRLDILPPTESLLPSEAGARWAAAMADALVQAEVPAATMSSAGRDWSLVMSAEISGNQVVPSYEVREPGGTPVGSTQGAPIRPSAWAAATPEVLKEAALQAAPGIVTLLARIDAARRMSDPHSLLNRPARVYVAAITGAPGDGNTTLGAQLRIKLQANGLVVQDTRKDADFSVRAEVGTAPGLNGTVRIELQWIVEDSAGERGRILQINEVPPKAIQPYWGDVAVAAASEAAGGVRDVIANSTGRAGATPQSAATK